MRNHRHLVVYVKEPRRGRVKTRLAQGIGWAEATRFYRQQTLALLRRLGCDRRWRLWLAVTPDLALRSGCWSLALPRLPQGRGDLGRRMPATFRKFAHGMVLIVGSDIPDMNPTAIWTSFRRLASADMIFGPAADGGYWLIGARGFALRRVGLKNVRWSSASALADSLQAQGDRRVAFSAELSDIDTCLDYESWRRTNKGLGFKFS